MNSKPKIQDKYAEHELVGSQIQTEYKKNEQQLSFEDQTELSQKQTDEDNYNEHLQFNENQELLNEDEKKNWYVLNFKLTRQQKLMCMIGKQILGALMLFFGAFMFIVMLEKTCPEEKYEFKQQCVDLLNSEINHWLKIFPLICFCLLGVTILGYYKFFEPYRIFMYLGLIEMIILCFCIYSLDLSKADERNFAPAQTLVLLAFLAIFTVLFFIVRGVVWLYYSKKIVFLGLVGVFAIFFGISMYSMSISCNAWDEGLDGYIDYEGPYCQLNEPSVCWPDVIDGWLDLSPGTCKISDKKYGETKRDALIYYGHANENTSQKDIDAIKFIAWPKTNKFTQAQRKFDTMQQSLLANSIIVASLQEAWDMGLEAAIDLDNLEFHINVQKDADVISAAQQRASENPDLTNGLADNVIVIYIDTLSRNQIHRKFKKSMKFLKQFVWEGEEEKSKKFYEFYRFHAIDKFTMNNNMKLHYDYKYDEIYNNFDEMKDQSQIKKYPNLMHQFKQSGHILAHSSNTCTSQCSFRDENSEISPFFDQDFGDHEFLMYDPLYINPENYFDSSKGPASMKRRCVYNNDTNAFVFDYGYKFLDAYKDEKKVLYLEFTDSHEITSEVVQYMDEHMYNFFLNIESKGLFDKKTMVFIMADHGQHLIPSFYMPEKPATDDMWEKAEKNPNKQYSQDVFKIERMLPVLQMMVSKDLLDENDELDDIFTKNRQVIFGMGDLRNTFVSAVQGSGVQNGKYDYNLLNYLNEENDCRNIGMVDTLNQEQFCVCRPRFDEK